MSGIPFNPSLTTNAGNTFLTDTYGFVQGFLLDDPAERQKLRGGRVISTASVPLWGGQPVTIGIPAIGGNTLGPTLTLATTIATLATAINGFVCYNQASNGLITPQSGAPLYPAGQTTNFVELGSGVRIALACDPALVSAAAGVSPQNVALQWDFTNARLEAFISGTALPIKVQFFTTNGKGVSYNTGTGAAAWTSSATLAICEI